MPFHPDHPTRARRPRPGTGHHHESAPPITTEPAPVTGALLYTPAEAAQLLKVRESWLRKKAAARQVPCTFLGKHLRFSPTDLASIVASAAQPPVGRRRRGRGSTPRDPDLMQPPKRSVDPPMPDDHNPTDGSNAWPG
jgi:excisionase family DNA binding protein